MQATENPALVHEWITLQNNYEHYEMPALLLKVSAIALTFAALAFSVNAFAVPILLGILWLQEGILKTCQARLGERILQIENQLAQPQPMSSPACQLHSTWLAKRKGTLGLLAEYAIIALKPTVAFPYAVLLLLFFAVKL